MLSVVGPETSVKALTAGLRVLGQGSTSGSTIRLSVGTINRTLLCRCSDGYRIYRTKLDYGLWHVLCLAKRPGFLPVLTDESLWQLLQGSPFTTPILREWVPWLYGQMKEREVLVELTQSGCQAGILLADSDTLDALVSEGIRQGHLAIHGHRVNRLGRKGLLKEDAIQTLDQYLQTYGSLLGRQAERSLEPLHVPGRDPLAGPAPAA